MSLRSQFPLKLIIGVEDCTQLLADGCTFSNVDPGGFEVASFQIPRDMPQSIRGQHVRLDCGLGVAWEGRISAIQRSLGNRTAITCEGYGALAKDEQRSMIFVDRNLSAWRGASLATQQTLITGGYSPSAPATAADPAAGAPALTQSCVGPWAANAAPYSLAVYDAQGIPIASVAWAWNPSSTLNLSDPNWTLLVQAADSDGAGVGGFDNTANLISGGSSVQSGTLAATTATRVFAAIEFYYALVAVGGANVNYSAYWDYLAVYGRHGLTKRGAAPSGFYPSDIVTWALSQIPGLQAGTIQLTDATGYIVPQSAYLDPVTLDVMLNDMAKASAWNWSVWEAPNGLVGSPAPRLDFQPRPADGTWQAFAWRHQCKTLDIHEDLNGLYDTAIVRYTQVDGTNRAVTVTISNPYLDQTGIGLGAGGPGRTILLNAGTLGGVGAGSSSAVAQAYGTVCLRLLVQQARLSGSITIETPIQDVAGGPMAAWMLRAGQQRIRIPDLPANDYAGAHNDLPVTRVECSISKDAISTTLDIGQGASLLETFQARQQTAAQLVGL